jgi:YVTN family beta-propeller protein
VSVTRDLPRGTLIVDYRIEAVLGRGGMSVVYLAEDLRLRRRVALKLLAPAVAEDVRFRERFLSESELAASLDHANVIPIYEAGEADGRLFIAMRYVEGSDLKARLGDGPLSAEETVAVAAQIGDALDAAHARGLVHGDVKPSNVLIDGSGHAYLADFGLTKRLGDERSLAGDGQLMGTIDYVAPEQIRGDQVDGRADIYSLGCLLYECLSGRQPFRRGNDAAVLFAHLEDQPPAIGSAADLVLAKALAKSPDDRQQTCAELAEAAREALGVAAYRRPRRLTAVIAALAVAVVAAASGLAFFLLQGGPAVAPHGVLLRIDPARNAIAGKVTVGPQPTGIAFGSGSVWVTSLGDTSVWRIDAGSLAASKLPTQGAPIAVAVRAGTAYVGNSGATYYGYGGQVTVIEAGAGVANHSIRTNGVYSLVNGRQGLWVATPQGLAKLALVSEYSDEITKRIPLPALGFWYPVLAEGDGSVWALDNALGHKLVRIDPIRARISATIPIALTAAGIAVGAGAVWVTGQLEDEVARIDPATNRVVKTVPVGREPLAVAVGGGSVWVANTIDRTVMRIDPATDRVVATIPLESSPTAITYGGGSLWVASDAS